MSMPWDLMFLYNAVSLYIYVYYQPCRLGVTSRYAQVVQRRLLCMTTMPCVSEYKCCLCPVFCRDIPAGGRRG